MQRRSFLKALIGVVSAALIPEEIILQIGKDILGAESKEYYQLKKACLERHAIEMERAFLFGIPERRN